MALPELPTRLSAIDPAFEKTVLELFGPNPGPAVAGRKPEPKRTLAKAEATSRGYFAMRLVNFILTQLAAGKQPDKGGTLPGVSSSPAAGSIAALPNFAIILRITTKGLAFLWSIEAQLKLRPYDLAKVSSNFASRLIQLGQYELAQQQLIQFRAHLKLPNPSAGPTKPAHASRLPIKATQIQRRVPLAPRRNADNAPPVSNHGDATTSPSLVFLGVNHYNPNDDTFNFLVITSLINALRCAVDTKSLRQLQGWVTDLTRSGGTCYDWCRILLTQSPSKVAHSHLDIYFRLLHKAAALFPYHDPLFLRYKRESLRVFRSTSSFSFAQLIDLTLHAALSSEKALQVQTASLDETAKRLDSFYDSVFSGGDFPAPSLIDLAQVSYFKLVEHRMLLNRKLPGGNGGTDIFGLIDELARSGTPTSPSVGLLQTIRTIYAFAMALHGPSGSKPISTVLIEFRDIRRGMTGLLLEFPGNQLPVINRLLTIMGRAFEFFQKCLNSLPTTAPPPERSVVPKTPGTPGRQGVVDTSPVSLPELWQLDGPLEHMTGCVDLIILNYRPPCKQHPPLRVELQKLSGALADLYMSGIRVLYKSADPTSFQSCRFLLDRATEFARNHHLD
ncbi:hypothetical protein BJ085DRAFT_35683, partial [Dimargaris cristalligena]